MIDWTASGIRNSFRYELVDTRDLDTVLGTLDVEPGGKLTEGWRTDCRQSASITVLGNGIPFGYAVRIWHDAELDGETATEELCTLMPKNNNGTYVNGVRRCTQDVYGSMYRLSTDRICYDSGVPAGTDVLSRFKEVVTVAGGSPIVADGLWSRNHVSSRDRVWECGDSVLTECNDLASTVDGRIDVDPHGHVIMVPYVNPSQMEVSYAIPTGAASLVVPGVGDSDDDVVNRVYAVYESQDTKYYSHADVPAGHRFSWERIGYRVAEAANVPSIEEGDDVQAKLDSAVSERITNLINSGKTLSVTMLYDPNVKPGRVVSFSYSDSDGEGISYSRCFVSQREITLDGSMSMQVTLEVQA